MIPKLPNLELIEYMFKIILSKDKDFQKVWKDIKEKHQKQYPNDKFFPRVKFSLEVFPQVWGSTCTAFDVLPDGSPAMGGCAMTEAYTVVVHEHTSDFYGIFIDNRLCYIVHDANEKFLEDIKNRNMASLGEAKKIY